MKKLKLYYLVTLLFFVSGLSLYSQNDSIKVYYPDYISVEYNEEGMAESYSVKTGVRTYLPYRTEIQDVFKLKLLNDSVISVSNNANSNVMININKLEGISIKSGSNTGTGIVLGGLIGLLAGAGIGAAAGSASESSGGGFAMNGLASAMGGLIGAGIGILTGGVIGGVIGGEVKSYKTYYLKGNNLTRKNEMERILKLDKAYNNY